MGGCRNRVGWKEAGGGGEGVEGGADLHCDNFIVNAAITIHNDYIWPMTNSPSILLHTIYTDLQRMGGRMNRIGGLRRVSLKVRFFPYTNGRPCRLYTYSNVSVSPVLPLH